MYWRSPQATLHIDMALGLSFCIWAHAISLYPMLRKLGWDRVGEISER